MAIAANDDRVSARRRDAVGLIGFLLPCLAISGLGGAITATSVGTWYQGLHKPAFNPPDWVFAPVWTTLFVLMAIAAWRVWRRRGVIAVRGALSMFGVQLVLNLGWSVVFFGLRQIGIALVEVMILLIAVSVTAALFWRIERLAGLLMVPYALWVGYATALNAALWLLN